MRVLYLAICASPYAFARSTLSANPFLQQINSTAWIIGNDIWNLTIGQTYGTKLMYKGYDLVGQAVGHYVSYNGAASNLNWTSAEIVKKSGDYTDICFKAPEGEMHWVLTPTLAGAYQYFVNYGLPRLGEFRTLWRLDNSSFTTGHTRERSMALPSLSSIQSGVKIQDETWLLADGSYITKYDFATFLPNIEGAHSVWGISGKLGGTGDEIGSWYIHGGKDYLNGNQLKQELMVHRESSTGDAVQLNMIHGTHFQTISNDSFPIGKTWGPWLWYINNGSTSDASARAQQESELWPYSWMQDTYGFQSRGKLRGRIELSDGRPATGAAVFLGDNNPILSSLDQGAAYYYRVFADSDGRFGIDNVREGTWCLQAWANGGLLSNVTTIFLKNDVVTEAGQEVDIGTVVWEPQDRGIIWQIGDFDHLATGFGYSGPPHEAGRSDLCPGDLSFNVGTSETSDWCFAQTKVGNWTVEFYLDSFPGNETTAPAAVLSVSLSGYSAGTSSMIMLNGDEIGNLTNIQGEAAVYRSATLAGELHYFEFAIAAGRLRQGSNSIDFGVYKNQTWRGFIYDTLLLEWV